MIAFLDRVTTWLPWRRPGHVRVCARTTVDQWSPLFDTAADAAHHLDEQVTCTGTWDGPWSIGIVDVGCYRMSRRQVEALRARVAAAVRGHQPRPTETLTSVCYPCHERHHEED